MCLTKPAMFQLSLMLLHSIQKHFPQFPRLSLWTVSRCFAIPVEVGGTREPHGMPWPEVFQPQRIWGADCVEMGDCGGAVEDDA